MTDHHSSSIDETHANDTAAQSRRGFLKRVAGAGLAGVAGIGAATQEARAATAQINFGSYSGRTYWAISSTEDVWLGNNTEHPDSDNGWTCEGYVSPGYKDTVYYTGWLQAIDIMGDGWAWLPHNISDDVRVVGGIGRDGSERSYYELEPHGTIYALSEYTIEASDRITSNIAKGYVYHNHEDNYDLSDGLKNFRVNGSVGLRNNWR